LCVSARTKIRGAFPCSAFFISSESLN
jgi:hypothetical protein